MAEIINGFPFKSGGFGAAGHPVIRIRDVARGFTNTRFDGDAPAGYWVEAGDLIVGMDGDFQTAFWRSDPALLNQRVCKVVPDETRIDRRYLAYILPGYLELVNANTPSVTVKHLSSRTLALIPLPLPPLDRQKAIADRVDELFVEIDDGEAALGRARDDLVTWRKGLLKAAVTGELTADWRAANPLAETGEDLLARILAERKAQWAGEPRNRGKRYTPPVSPAFYSGNLPVGWSTASMPQLGDFGRGKSKHRPRNDARLYGGPYPFVQTGVVSASRGKITRHEQTYTALGLAQSKLWPAETLCITIAANIAKTGVLQFDACFPDSVVGLSCAAGVLPAYVELVIRRLQQGLEDDAPATAQKNINLETLETLPIPLPPSCEQAAIVAAFEEAEVADDLLMRDDVDVAAATLRRSVLAAAFRGELA